MACSSNIFRVLLVLVVCSITVVQGQGIDTQVENFELSDANPNSCEAITSVSRFSGDCCSLSNADSGGCVLNVVNGNCVIKGQYWSLNWTSTLTANDAKCPESVDYPEYAPAANADDSTDPPVAVPKDGGLGMRGGITSTLAAGFIAAIL